MSKPPFKIPMRAGTQLWPRVIQLPTTTTFVYNGIGDTAEEKAEAVEAARRNCERHDGAIKQFYLHWHQAVEASSLTYLSKSAKIAPGIEARYTTNYGMEYLYVKSSAQVKISETKPVVPERPVGVTVFVSVIDESSQFDDNPGFLSGAWSTLRRAYPDVPFFLLWPGVSGDPVSLLHVPSAFRGDPRAYGPITVPRDTEDFTPWTDLMLREGIYVLNAYICVDNSGSMTTSTVSAQLGQFYGEIKRRGGKSFTVETMTEDWLSSFINGDFNEFGGIEL